MFTGLSKLLRLQTFPRSSYLLEILTRKSLNRTGVGSLSSFSATAIDRCMERGSPLTESHQLPFYGPFARSVKCWRGNLSLVTRNDWCSVFKGRVALWGSVYDFLGLLCGVRDTYLCTYLRIGQENFPSRELSSSRFFYQDDRCWFNHLR